MVPVGVNILNLLWVTLVVMLELGRSLRIFLVGMAKLDLLIGMAWVDLVIEMALNVWWPGGNDVFRPKDCRMRNGTCMSCSSRHMLQFLSLMLAKVPAELGLVKLYGYIAALDSLNPLLN
jgi:hypothetical protein